eukprot:TRINITY_DN20187_c0_g1::TRINITY_DN20187_c0_g1_i1::g.30303::m.30303 TRINITY_DN20187_c0_g1::TRINITY_DN20187_c0_g1_i1::g.30303  ORF type:complete len:342 (+),score=32.63,sp/G5EDR3/2AB1_CAEEL/23.18/1e-10 TRINITY_DN20187_c0_g1_i1:316-1341(+)
MNSKSVHSIQSIEWIGMPKDSGEYILTASDATVEVWKYNHKTNSSKIVSLRGSWREASSDHLIQNVSKCPDGETVLICDESSITLASCDLSDSKATLVAINDSRQDFFTCARAHPFYSTIFSYSYWSGGTRFADTRIQGQSRILECGSRDQDRLSFPASSTSLNFSPTGTELISRDMYTQRVYDIRKADITLEAHSILPRFHTKLKRLQEKNPTIGLNSFTSGMTHNARFLITGVLTSTLRVYDRQESQEMYLSPLKMVRIPRDLPSPNNSFISTPDSSPQMNTSPSSSRSGSLSSLHDVSFSEIGFDLVTPPSWQVALQPNEGSIAFSAGSSVCLTQILT